LVRKAVEIASEADAVDIAKTGRHGVGGRGLAAAVTEHFLDLLDHRRRYLGIEKAADTEKESTSMTHSEFVRDVVKRYGITAFCKSMVQHDKSYDITEPELVEMISEDAQAEFSA
jgi:hypothetical protein